MENQLEREMCKDRLARRKLLLECKYSMKPGKVEAKSTERGKQHWGWTSRGIGGVKNNLHAEEGSKTARRYG